ncbi:PREDICTED: lysosomal protective protein-like [Priapulus caudatus]|uniref:Carboxypeptidase n=1 Tax=Priapulus caudatus TaxID=37621 RepID=A0ABM1EE71_PRICU|nr:PREDICTED: lysosomal protective protein-like [Priapulus caudatus]XP_014670502.1 PREDICTED: lysosomal protective protein-like [Priapulus caudatus]
MKCCHQVVAQVACLVLGCVMLTATATKENPDEVTRLPGLPYKLNFRHYSGYLKASGTKRLHYWFVESQDNPQHDPLLLWMNGGPGCSSLDGFLSELGPFYVRDNGRDLYLNTYSWNTIANVLFLEAPAGVGFSYSEDGRYGTDDDTVSMDNYLALQDFFSKYPQFLANDFYVTGESYGGIYVPTLSLRVLNGTTPIRLKGFAVGNGLTSYAELQNSIVFFAYYHGLFGETLWHDLLANCCKGPGANECDFQSSNPDCTNNVGMVEVIVTMIGLNVYSLYQDCATGASAQSLRYQFDMQHVFPALRNKSQADNEAIRIIKNMSDDGLSMNPPCIDASAVTTWLNRSDVREALHIPASVQPWELCSQEVGSQYKTLYKSMMKQYQQLLPHVRALVYNGDTDMACNFLGDEWFVESLKRKVTSARQPWKFNHQVAGFVKQFENIDFVTIKGAGHMVPQFKPGQALKMIKSWLNQEPY